jgi:hypothetical protein
MSHCFVMSHCSGSASSGRPTADFSQHAARLHRLRQVRTAAAHEPRHRGWRQRRRELRLAAQQREGRHWRAAAAAWRSTGCPPRRSSGAWGTPAAPAWRIHAQHRLPRGRRAASAATWCWGRQSHLQVTVRVAAAYRWRCAAAHPRQGPHGRPARAADRAGCAAQAVHGPRERRRARGRGVQCGGVTCSHGRHVGREAGRQEEGGGRG